MRQLQTAVGGAFAAYWHAQGVLDLDPGPRLRPPSLEWSVSVVTQRATVAGFVVAPAWSYWSRKQRPW